MITRFIVLFVVALLSLFSPGTLAQNSCTDSNALRFEAAPAPEWLSNAHVRVRWYANYTCTREYRVCWNGTSGSGCRNATTYNQNTDASMDIDYPHGCRQLSLSLEAFPNPPILNDIVTATTTIVTLPEEVQSVKLSQPFGQPTVRVEWLYWIPENHCSSNFIVAWCAWPSFVCNWTFLERNVSSYNIEDLEFCTRYILYVRVENKANNHTSDYTQVVTVDQARNLEVSSINSTSVVLRWAPRNVSLCTDGGEVCFIQSNLTGGEARPTCYSDLKITDTSVTIIGLQPSTSYNFTYYSSYFGSLIPPQTLEFVETPSGVSRTFTTYYTTVLTAITTILLKHFLVF